MDQIDRQRMAVKRVIDDEVEKAIRGSLEADNKATVAGAFGGSRHYSARRERLDSGFRVACDRAVTLLIELDGDEAAQHGDLLDSLLSEGQERLQAHFDRGRQSARAFGDQISGQSEALKGDLDRARAHALNDLQLGIVGGRRVQAPGKSQGSGVSIATFDPDSFLTEYDDVTRDVSRSDRTTFNTNLARWFELLGETPVISSTIRSLEELVDFPNWLDDNKGDGDLGGGTLQWPRGRERLAMQLAAFRWMNEREDNYVRFYGQFNGASGHYDDMVHDVTGQHFEPMARDLRRHLQGSVSPAAVREEVPASDRMVTIDHNNPDYQPAIESLEQTLEALRGFNGYASEEEKETQLAEVGAMRIILKGIAVSAQVARSLLQQGLKTLTEKFVDTAVSAAAAGAFVIIGRLLGLW